MTIEFSLVSQDLFDCAFDDEYVQSQIDRAATFTSGRVLPEDIISMVREGRYQLWLAFDPDPSSYKTYGVLITELKQYPRKKFLCVQHCAGELGILESAGVNVLTTIENFAKDEKCDGVEFVGRFGWVRFARKNTYKPRSQVFQKLF